MRKIIFVLCEGPHDVAFLYRILKTLGLENYPKKIKEYPSPINDFLSQSAQRLAIEEMKLDEIRQRPLPSEALTFRDETLLLLYSVHGDSREPVRREIVTRLADLLPDDSDAFDPSSGLGLAVLYFFDADALGVSQRLTQVKTELAGFFGKTLDDGMFQENACLHEINGLSCGAYIFAASGGVGKLEDLLTPLMRQENEEIFDKAESYLELKDNSRLKKLEIKTVDGEIQESRGRRKMKFDPPKSTICIAGQLQNSGKSNVVIIKDCDYLNLEKIQHSPACQEIADFFKKVL